MKHCFAYILLFLCSMNIFGTGADSLDADAKKLTVLPFAYYTSDTSFAFGIFAQYVFDEEDMTFGNAVYTLKNQFMFLSITDKKLGNTVFHNTLKIKDYFSEVYGIGNRTTKRDIIKYRYFQADNLIEAGKKTSSYSAVYGSVNNFIHIPESSGKYIDELSAAYSEEKTQFANGLGISYKYSSVTRKFFRDGFLFKTDYLFYPEAFGNVKQFSVFSASAGYFYSYRESSINTLFSSRFTTGSTHPEKLSFIGGSEIMRGYPEKRFMDKNMVSLQTQYDVRVYKNIAGCVFISAGDVFSSLSDLSLKKTKTGYGAGILYEFKGLNMRLDLAYSPESSIKEPQIIILGLRAF